MNPRARAAAVYVSAAVLGAAPLLPWKMIQSNPVFLERKFRGVAHAQFMLELCFVVPFLCGLAYTTATEIGRRTFALLVPVCLVVSAAVFGAVILVAALKEAAVLRAPAAWALLCLAAAFQGANTAALQGSLYGAGGVLGRNVLQALQMGKGAVGVFFVAVRLLVHERAAKEKWLAQSALALSLLSIAVVLASLLIFVFVFARLTRRSVPGRPGSRAVGPWSDGGDDALDAVNRGAGDVSDVDAAGASTPTTRGALVSATASGAGAAGGAAVSPAAAADSVGEDRPLLGDRGFDEAELGDGGAGGRGRLAFRGVVAGVWPMAVGAFAATLVTFFLFPYTLRLLSSPHLEDGTFHLLLVAAFGGGDLLGKTVPRFACVLSRRTILSASFALVVFVPLCALPVVGAVPAAFGDVYAAITLAALGIASGYVVCSAMMLGPGEVDMRGRWTAGMVESLCLVSGVSAGAFLGFAVAPAFEHSLKAT